MQDQIFHFLLRNGIVDSREIEEDEKAVEFVKELGARYYGRTFQVDAMKLGQ